MGHGQAGVVGVPQVWVGLEGGCSMAVVAAWVFMGIHPLVAVGTATPRRWAITAMPKAAAAGRGPVRAARAVPSLVLGLWFSFRIRGRCEVHLLLRVALAAVLVLSSCSVGFAGGVVPVQVGGPWGVGLLLGFRPGEFRASGGVVSGQLHALVVVDGLATDNRELGLVVELLIGDRRQAGTKFVAEDASQEPRARFPR